MKKIFLSVFALLSIFCLVGCKKESSKALTVNKDAMTTQFYKEVIVEYENIMDMDTKYVEDSSVDYDANKTKHYEVYIPKNVNDTYLNVMQLKNYTKKSKVNVRYGALSKFSDYNVIISILNSIESINNFAQYETLAEPSENYFETEADQRVLCVEYLPVLVEYVQYQDEERFPTLYTIVLVPIDATLTTLKENVLGDANLSSKYDCYYTFDSAKKYVDAYTKYTI